MREEDSQSSSEAEEGGKDGSESSKDPPPVKHVPIVCVPNKNLFWTGTEPEPSVPPVPSVPLNLGVTVKELQEELQRLSLQLRLEQSGCTTSACNGLLLSTSFQLWNLQYSRHRSRETEAAALARFFAFQVVEVEDQQGQRIRQYLALSL